MNGRKRGTATTWLVIFVLAVMLTPRIRLTGDGGQNIDLRLQDLLLIPMLIFLVVDRRHCAPLLRLWSWLLPLFLYLALATVTILMIVDPEVSAFRRIAFFARGLELFVIAAVVAGFYLRAGPGGLRGVLGAIHFAACANFGWVAVQLATGQNQTLIGGEVGDGIESYGPKLIGEASAFGAGQFFAFVAAVGVAELRARIGRPLISLAVILMGAIGVVAVESRVSIAAVLVGGLVLLLLSTRRSAIHPVGATYAVLLAGIAALVIVPRLAGRLAPDAVLESLGFRAQVVWEPLLEALGRNILLGVGPGGLVDPLPIEGHNIVLRALLDYGVVGGTVFILLFVVVLVRAARRTVRADRADTRVFSNLVFVFLLALFVVGMFQDALTGVTSSHLAMISIGLFAAVGARDAGALPEGKGAIGGSRNGPRTVPGPISTRRMSR